MMTTLGKLSSGTFTFIVDAIRSTYYYAQLKEMYGGNGNI